jgi:hypothetical protein
MGARPAAIALSLFGGSELAQTLWSAAWSRSSG